MMTSFFVVSNDPDTMHAQLDRLSANYHLPFCKVNVYHKAKCWESDFPLYRHASNEYNVVHVSPTRWDTWQHPVPSLFDTVLVNDGMGVPVGVNGA